MHPSGENQNQQPAKDEMTQNNTQGVILSPRSDGKRKKKTNHCLKKQVIGCIYAYLSEYFSKSVEPHSKMLKIRAQKSKPQRLIYPIFHVQVTGAPESEGDHQAEELIPAERKSTDKTSAKLGEWETLMDAKPIPNLGERCAFVLLIVSPQSPQN